MTIATPEHEYHWKIVTCQREFPAVTYWIHWTERIDAMFLTPAAGHLYSPAVFAPCAVHCDDLHSVGCEKERMGGSVSMVGVRSNGAKLQAVTVRYEWYVFWYLIQLILSKYPAVVISEIWNFPWAAKIYSYDSHGFVDCNSTQVSTHLKCTIFLCVIDWMLDWASPWLLVAADQTHGSDFWRFSTKHLHPLVLWVRSIKTHGVIMIECPFTETKQSCTDCHTGKSRCTKQPHKKNPLAVMESEGHCDCGKCGRHKAYDRITTWAYDLLRPARHTGKMRLSKRRLDRSEPCNFSIAGRRIYRWKSKMRTMTQQKRDEWILCL